MSYKFIGRIKLKYQLFNLWKILINKNHKKIKVEK